MTAHETSSTFGIEFQKIQTLAKRNARASSAMFHAIPAHLLLLAKRGSRGLVGSREVLHAWGAGGVRCPFYSDEGSPAPNCRRPEGHGAACKPATVAGRKREGYAAL